MGFVVAVIAIIWLFILNGRVKDLEKKLEQRTDSQPQVSLGQGQQAPPVSQNTPAVTQVPVDSMGAVQPLSAESLSQEQRTTTAKAQGVPPMYDVAPSEPARPSAFVTWLKNEWPMKLGALFLLIALGWFVSYAFANNWIGPMGRIVLGLLFGIGLLSLGSWRIVQYKTQGGVFIVVGSTIILLTLFAAREIYDFFTPITALMMMLAANVFVTLQSLRFNYPSLAIAGLLLAGFSPFLTASPDPGIIDDFLYILAITSGFLWIVYLKGWQYITSIALGFVFLYTLPFISFDRTVPNEDIALLFSFLFTAIFFGAHVASIVRHKPGGVVSEHVIVALGLGIYLMSWIFAAVKDEWQSLILVTWSVLFAAGSFIVFKATTRREPFYVYSAICVALIAAATAVELSGPALNIAYIVETGIAVGVAYALTQNLDIARKISFLIAGPILLSFQSMVAYALAGKVLTDDFAALSILTLALFTLGVFIMEEESKVVGEEKHEDGKVFLTVASIYTFALVWLVSHNAFTSDELATTISLIIYTISGIALYSMGLNRGQNGMRIGGGVLLGLVTARLLLVDVWDMELGARIITFFVIGILLVGTAFISRKSHSEHIET